MHSLWNITIDDYIEVVERAQKAGVKPGESMESIFLAYMKEKNQKPCANTEQTKEELLADLAERGGNILDITTNDKGETSYTQIKKGE